MTDDEKAQAMAEKMGKNASQADIDNVAAKLDSMNKGPLAAIWDKIQAMWKAFNSPSNPCVHEGDYYRRINLCCQSA